MKKGFLRCIAVIMVVVMTALCAPVSDLSDLFDVEASAIVTSGKVKLGNNIKWEYNKNSKTITVSGSGAMYDFSNGDSGQCWDELVLWTSHYPNKDAQTLVIGEGITYIGNHVFNGLKGIKTVTIPSTVTGIGAAAFANCSALTSVTVPVNVKTIGASAFEGCSALSSVTISSGVTTIGANAFKNAKSAKIAAVPASVKSIGSGAFSGVSKVICNYGTYAYNYCITNKLTNCAVPKNTLVAEIVTNKDNTVKLVLKMVYNKAKFAAGNFTLSYSNATASNTKTVNTESNGVLTSVVHNKTGKYSIAVMAADYVPYSSSAAICEYKVAELTFKSVNCKSAFTFSADTLLINDAKASIDSAKASLNTHTYKNVITKATLSKGGKIENKCSVCGNVKSSTAIRYVKTVALATTSYTYDGTVKKPAVTVKDSSGKALKSGTDYTVTYASGRKAPGTYKVTVTMKGNYSGTKTLTFKINPIDVSKCSIKLAATSYTYDGKVKTPSVTVKNAKGTTLKSGTDYTVTYASGRKAVGQYKVTVTMKGNYSGTKTITFNILPGKTSKITATPATTTLKAAWSKVTGATGYKVELLNANGKVVKSVTTKNVNYTFTKLTAGTTYKVKVTAYKTISGKNQYSLVSTTLSTATKVATPTLKVTSTKKGVANFTWTNVAGENGYEVYYSTSKSSGFKSAASYKTNVAKGSKSKLTSKKTYYFKVRAYKTVGGKKVYGDWSKVVSVKVK